MPSAYVMGYYHPFPEAIPLLKAGCSRVTHPSATNLKKQASSRPFDLHVLGVPPAFVLSQDQTLYEVCISKSLDFKYLFNPDSLRLLAITSFLFKTQFRFYSDWNLQGFCINSIVQFSRYHFVAWTFVLSNFIIISYSNQFVKYFFKVFWKLFWIS